MREVKVYLAGKVRKGDQDWRSELFGRDRCGLFTDVLETTDGRRVRDPDDSLSHILAEIYRPLIAPGLVYGGPIMLANDHGAYHGTNMHGAGCSSIHYDREGEICDPTSPQYSYSGPIDGVFLDMTDKKRRQYIFTINTELIKRADALFAWIDSRDAFGTLVEIGQAHQLGKHVFVGIDVDIKGTDDFWYAGMCSTVNGGRFECAGHAFMCFEAQCRAARHRRLKA